MKNTTISQENSEKIDTHTIWIVWSTWAVWVKLHELLNNHPVFKDCLSDIPHWLSKLQWKEWIEKIISIFKNNTLVILAVHDDIARKIIEVKEKTWITTKVIDCSTAYRTDQSWTYGLPEIKNLKKKIEGSELISNPWCHATAAILSIKPLTEKGLIKMHSAIITSITWYSWGWKEMIAQYQQDPQQPSYQYSTWAQHKHVWEIKKQTWLEDLIFQPEVVDYFNWLKTNAFLPLTQKWKELSQQDFIHLFKKYYEWKRFIKVSEIPDNGKIYMNENNGTQNTSIYIKKYPDTLQIIAVIDNMMKGAAWSVIQNMNIMLWLEEGIGL